MSPPRVLYEFGRFRIDPQRRRLLLRADGTMLAVPPRVFDTLLCLVEQRGEIVGKAALMSMIWPRMVVEENSLNRNIFLLRRILGESPEDHRYIVTAPGLGFRFVADVEVIPEAPSESTAAPRAVCVAVLPFANPAQDPALEYLCSGIPDELIQALTGNDGIHVVCRLSSFACAAQPHTDARLIARDLGAGCLVTGSVRAGPDGLRVAVQLIDGHSGQQRWSQSFNRAADELLMLQQELQRAVRGTLRSVVPETTRGPGPPTQDVRSYRRLLEAEWLLHTIPSEPNVRRAIALMQQVVAEDPRCARAFARLADAHSIADGMRYGIADALAESERYARRALELDAGEWGPHIVLAEAHRTRAEWSSARQSYDAGVALGRNTPMALARRSMGLWLNVGSLGRAFEDALQAHLTAPARPETAMFVALAALAGSRDEEAGWYAELAHELGFPPAFGHMPVIRALLESRQGSRPQPGEASVLAATAVAPGAAEKWRFARLAMSGAVDDAYRLAAQLLATPGARGGRGEEWWVLWLAEMRDFRRDVRFQELVANLGLMAYWRQYGPPDGHDLRAGTLIVP
jgi:TolB-like protein